MNTDNDLEHYMVTWEDTHTGDYRRDRVLVEPGVSTTDDVPTMLAIRYFGSVNAAPRVRCHRVRPLPLSHL